ncbi:uncharacterized protein LOC128988058 [Macrosteles quadrilineatus]|uniref:uncharacterized protein LOC128988058 n=1 Tax=Macrosteles quadrilineatus TaxID=74068 RepID=UPI0023E13910|nr:uncharacterized protein LOC128988058 [Macrosteles quadrilineatus]
MNCQIFSSARCILYYTALKVVGLIVLFDCISYIISDTIHLLDPGLRLYFCHEMEILVTSLRLLAFLTILRTVWNVRKHEFYKIFNIFSPVLPAPQFWILCWIMGFIIGSILEHCVLVLAPKYSCNVRKLWDIICCCATYYYSRRYKNCLHDVPYQQLLVKVDR